MFLIFQKKGEKTLLWTTWMQFWPPCQNLSGKQSVKTYFSQKILAAAFPPKVLRFACNLQVEQTPPNLFPQKFEHNSEKIS